MTTEKAYIITIPNPSIVRFTDRYVNYQDAVGIEAMADPTLQMFVAHWTATDVGCNFRKLPPNAVLSWDVDLHAGLVIDDAKFKDHDLKLLVRLSGAHSNTPSLPKRIGSDGALFIDDADTGGQITGA